MRLLLICIIIAIGMAPVNTKADQLSGQEIVKLSNKYRKTPLTIDPALSFIAQTKANDMVNKNYFSHNTPDGHRFFYFLQQLGYSYQSAGENLAIDYNDNSGVVKAWMKSASHKKNIINPRYSKVGIGIANKDGHNYIVQLFVEPIKK